MTSGFRRKGIAAAIGAATAMGLISAAHVNAQQPAAIVSADEEDSAVPAAPGWRLDPELRLTVRGVTSEARTQAEDETLEGDAIALVAAPALSLTNGETRIRLRNAVSRIEYLDEARTDRWQNVARLSGGVGLAERATLTLFGERSDNLFAAEFSSADEWEAGAALEYRLDPANRVSLGASWRERSYDDIEQSEGSGVRIDAEYRHRFAANHFLRLRARHERIASVNARRDLSRWLAEAAYQRPVARDLRIGTELSWQRLDFSGRPLAGGGVRQDVLVTPEVNLTYSPGPWRLAARARYVVRDSSDPEFDRSGYRLELEVSHAF